MLPLTVNGIQYNYPEEGDENWGPDATNWAQAVTNGMLQKSGGLFTLTSEVDFGPSFGLKSLYYKSRATSPASAGIVRLGNAELVSWRNAGNTADLSVRVNSSNWLQFNSIDLVDISTVQTISNKVIGSNLLPSAHNTYDLGSNAVRWKDGYFQGNVAIAGSLTAGSVTLVDLTMTGNTVIGDANTDTLDINADLISDIRPDASNTYDLGSSSNRWRDIYVSRDAYTLRLLSGDGSAANPSITFENDPDTGIYSAGGNGVNIAAGGGQVAGFASNGIRLVDGSAALPSYTFISDTNLGIYRISADSLGFSAAGALIGSYSSTGLWTLGAVGGVQTHSILGNATMSFPTAGSRAVFQIEHTDTTNATSHAVLQLTSPGASSGDPYIQFLINTVQNWSAGVDNSDGDEFKISASNFLGTNDYFSITPAGLVTIGALSSAEIHRINGSVDFASSGSDSFVQDPGTTATLADNTTDTVFSLTAANYNSAIVDCSLRRGSARFTGILCITHDGTNAEVATLGSSIGTHGVTFTADISGGNLRLRYTTTSTGSAATMKYSTKRWNNP